MRALRVSIIVFAIVAIIGIAIILGRFVFKLGPIESKQSENIIANAEIYAQNPNNEVYDPAQMLPPSPVIEKAKPQISQQNPNALEAMAAQEAAANCNIAISKPVAIDDWNTNGNVIAISEGSDCNSILVRILVKNSAGKTLYTMSAPARDFGISQNPNSQELKTALDSALPNAAIHAKTYPAWTNESNKPQGTEFSQSEYEAMRNNDEPIICIKLPSAPQTCIAATQNASEMRTFAAN
jgi:hypothetical protein